MSTPEIDALCVGVCMVDAEGYCLGCGRPPLNVVIAAADGDAVEPAAARAYSTTAGDHLQTVAAPEPSALSTRLTQ